MRARRGSRRNPVLPERRPVHRPRVRDLQPVQLHRHLLLRQGERRRPRHGNDVLEHAGQLSRALATTARQRRCSSARAFRSFREPVLSPPSAASASPAATSMSLRRRTGTRSRDTRIPPSATSRRRRSRRKRVALRRRECGWEPRVRRSSSSPGEYDRVRASVAARRARRGDLHRLQCRCRRSCPVHVPRAGREACRDRDCARDASAATDPACAHADPAEPSSPRARGHRSRRVPAAVRSTASACAPCSSPASTRS